MRPAKILIAEEKSLLRRVSQALAGYELLEATSLAQAQRLTAGIDLFVIGVHLDESQAMSLVQFIRMDPDHQTTPIMMLRIWPSSYAQALRNTLGVMKTVQGINDYLELEDDPRAPEKIRAAAEQCLPAEKCLDRKNNDRVFNHASKAETV